MVTAVDYAKEAEEGGTVRRRLRGRLGNPETAGRWRPVGWEARITPLCTHRMGQGEGWGGCWVSSLQPGEPEWFLDS